MSDAVDAQAGSESRKPGTSKPFSLRSVLALCIVGVQFVSVLIVIFLVYFGMDRAIMQQSRELLEQRSESSSERIASFFLPSVQINEMLVKLVESGTTDPMQNHMLERLFHSALRTSPEISGIYFGRPDGTFIQVLHREGEDDTTTKWVDEPGKGATFLTRNEGYVPTGRYTDPNDGYDPRLRTWYVQASDAGSNIWTDTYQFFTTGKLGLTYASPVYLDGEFLGVFGTDIELWKLGQMLEANGEGLMQSSSILTVTGDVVVHVKGNEIAEFTHVDALAARGDTTIKTLFERYVKSGDAFFAQYEPSGEDGETAFVLANIRPLENIGLPWLIATRAPQTELTGSLLENQSRLLLTAILSLAVMSLIAVPLADRIRKPVLDFGMQNSDSGNPQGTIGPWLKAPYSELETAGQTLAKEISKRRNFEIQYDRTFKVSSRGMARIDPKTMRFLHVNSRLCQILEMQEEDILNSGLHLLLANDQQKTLGRFRDAVTSDKDFTIEAPFKTGQNGLVSLRMTAFLMRDFRGNPDHAFAIFDNNEESKMTAARLEYFKRDVDRIGRINLMGQFAAGLAHELNQPLGALVHDVDSAKFVLKEDVVDHAELEEILSDIDGHAHRAGEIIRALRNMINKDSKTSFSFELNDLLEQTLAILKPEATAYDVSIETLASDRFSVKGNYVQIAQALVNLIRNAISALSSGECRNRSVMLQATERGGQVVISVEDNGPGFPAHLTPFTQFETTKPDGLGLGLSICKSLVEANGGTIVHMKGAEGGARFEITLPGRNMSKEFENNG